MQPLLNAYLLSPQQRRLWSAQAEGAPTPAELELQIEGPLDLLRLRQALEGLVRRHEILRTRFQRQPGMKYPFQVVESDGQLDWTTLDLSSLHTDAQQARIREFWAFGASGGFDHLPSLRAGLWTRDQNRHSLTLSLSPLCVDGGSLHRLALELFEFYAHPEQALAEPIQYADYSQWRNELLRSGDSQSASAKAFWEAQELRSIPALTVPFQARSRADGRFESASLPVVVPRRLEEKINAEGSESRDYLLACWAALVSRWSGQSELVLAYVTDGRLMEGLGESLGLFAAPLPFRCSVEGQTTIGELARRLGQRLSDTLEWADYFDYENSAVEPRIGFAVEPSGRQWHQGEMRFSLARIRCQTSFLSAQLRCRLDPGNWSLHFDYDSRFLSPPAARTLAKQAENLLRRIAESPDLALDSLDIMDPQERQRVLTGFNQTRNPAPQPRSIHEAFEEQTRRTPLSVALRFKDRTFSYADLNQRANQVAHFLRRHGVARNATVGLCVERSAEMIVGLLGILKSGGCYVPLAPDNPSARLEHQVRESGASALVTQEHLVPRLPRFSGAVLCLDRDQATLSIEADGNPGDQTEPDDLAYVIYTSGSTGTPKGVAVRHRNLVNYSTFMCRRLNLEKAGRGLHFATVSTITADLGNTCIFPGLISGGCLHVIDYETAMAASVFAEYVKAHPIDILKITPSHLASLLAAADGRAILPRACLVLGGEASSWELARRILELSNCRVLNHYGPTEATVGCCTFDLRAEDVGPWNPATVPIGRPIDNVQIYILDAQMRSTPIGVPGEIYIGGAGIAQGYLNQPQQTAERFVRDPFSPDADSRLYRTGDLARCLPDGNIEFLGRTDQQIKIRGFRVEPAEIEAALKQHPAVKQVFTAPYEERAGDKRLAAYTVTSTSIKSAELVGFLAARLPDYMVPTIIPIASLPLTPNGKVDVRALPSPAMENKLERRVDEPTTAAEQEIAAIWCEVLGIERVGIHENFFELGGHSLLATQIIARIRNRFRVQLPLHGFLETPTIARLAEKIAQCPKQETEEEELERLLAEIEGLSDAEAGQR